MTIYYVKRRRFNTKTATYIACWESGCHQSDFNWTREALYISPKGQFFIEGEGNAASKYAKSVGSNSWGAGTGFKLLSQEDAFEWLENKELLTEDIITKHFPSLCEDG
tara:strand:- start:1331 stop:1654 length:324 start_codon:yes stop_codon:yes gene_type:complete